MNRPYTQNSQLIEEQSYAARTTTAHPGLFY